MQPQQYIIHLFLQLFLTVTFAYQSPNVWTTFGELAVQTKGVNLGQGYPDWQPPQFVLDSLQSTSFHQYTRPAGHPKLVELLADRYGRHLDRSIRPMNEVAVTVGQLVSQSHSLSYQNSNYDMTLTSQHRCISSSLSDLTYSAQGR